MKLSIIVVGVVVALQALAHMPVKAGRWKTFTYDKPDKTPVVFGGWSRADGVRSCEYCVSLDVQYADGSKEWGLGRQANWRQGTHDWEYACTALVPKKPIAKIDAFVFNRGGTGKAEFRDIFLERREGKGDRINYARMTVKPFADEDEVSYGVFTGRKIDKKTERAPSTFSFPPPPDGVTVWTASPMDLVTPLTLPPHDATKIAGTTGGPPVAAKAIVLSLARRERESAQLLVSCGADTELAGVTLEIDPLKDASGKELEGEVKWERVGYVPRKAGYLRHPCSPEDREMWLPDPLLPAAPFKVRRASTQGAWITVYAAPGAKPGTYRSEVRVRQDGKTLAAIPLSATVLDFELGATFALDTAFSLMDGFLRAEYPETWRQMKKQAIDVMLDHCLNPDDISRISPPEIEDLLHAKARGMSRFNILNIVPEPKDPEVKWVFSAGPSELFTEKFYQAFTGRLRPYLKQLEANGLDGMAYIYGFDEVPKSYFLGMDRMWKRLKADFPNLPMMTTSKMFRALVRGKTNDFHCVTTDWYCPVSSDYDMKWADYLRAKGKKVWWYTCCSPGSPFANMASLEYPAVEGRLLLGYLTWLYRADGFLFWHVNNWRKGNAPMDETDTYFPEWNTWNYLGIPEDGIFLYPGKEHILPSIRFANIRDGEEDYEYLLRAEKKLGRQAVEALVRPLVRSQTNFTRDSAALSSLRDRLKCTTCK